MNIIMETATLYLIPVPISESGTDSIPEQVKNLTLSIRHFFVENTRTARRYLKSLDKAIDIDAIEFSEINQHQEPDLALLRQWIQEKHTIGIMSEAGCPGVADPGSTLVAAAHRAGALVKPLTGPSSILLALMASGFNGQSFRFSGYLPVKEPMRGKALKALEILVQQKNETQIFIETPYRNNQLLQEIMKHCSPKIRLCIAANITEADEMIKAKSLEEWKKQLPDLHKQTVIFLMGS